MSKTCTTQQEPALTFVNVPLSTSKEEARMIGRKSV